MSATKRFGIALRELRKQRGLTQEELAVKIDRSTDSVSQLERGINEPSFETLYRLSEALQVPAAFLLSLPDQNVTDQKYELVANGTAILLDLSERDLKIAIQQLKSFLQ
jgi:putative transcriptional regulator